MNHIEFVNIAYTAYGGAWLGPLAEALGLQESVIRKLIAGNTPIPRRVASEALTITSTAIAVRTLVRFDQQVALTGRPAATIRVARGGNEADRLSSRLIAKGLRRRGYRVVLIEHQKAQ
jgi:hypothetical protein